MDIGQPKDFITGTRLHLASLKRRYPELLDKSECVRGNVFTVSIVITVYIYDIQYVFFFA